MPLKHANMSEEQPFHCDLQRPSCKTHWNYAQQLHKLQLQNRISTPKRKNDDSETLFKRNLKRKIIYTKLKKSAAKAPFATSMQPLQYDLRQGLAKHNQNRKTLLNTIRAAVAQPFHCDLHRLNYLNCNTLL